MSDNQCLRQSYNKRSRKWVLIDCSEKGGIKSMQPEKYEGIPIIKDKPGENEYTDAQESQPGKKKKENEDTAAAEKRKPQPPAGEDPGPTGPDNNEGRKNRRFLW